VSGRVETYSELTNLKQRKKNTMKKTLTVLATLALASITSFASAEDFTLNAQGGPALNLRAPNADVVNRNTFNIGAQGEVDGLFAIVPNVAIGPTVSSVYLPRSAPNTEESTLWQFDGTVRVQGNHNAGWYPYIQGSLGAGKQGTIWNPAFMTQVGVNFALNQEHSSWLGVYVGWDKVLDTYNAANKQTPLLNREDPSIGTAGVSMSFDFPSKHVAVAPVVQTRTVVQEHTVMQQVAVPVPVNTVQDGSALLVLPSVQFDKGSFVVSAEAQTALTSLATDFKELPAGFMLVVEGYASAEGDSTANLVLANNRAHAVANFLGTQGVDAASLHPVAFGATGEPNDASNRRVDTIVVRLVKVSQQQ
jgi:outer membrane protein OmpA-like peptidoglycan-associated protein